MIVRIFALFIITLSVIIIRLIVPEWNFSSGADAAMALGFVLAISFFAGKAFSRFGIPAITGYIITGILFGPYLLSGIDGRLCILNKQTIDNLDLIDAVALGLIALTAGGELKLATVRKRLKSISWIILFHVIVVTLGVGAVIYLIMPFSGLSEGFSDGQIFAMVILFGVTAVAKSPATTIAVIQEVEAKGPVTDVILAVTVAKDVVVITLFTFAVASCRAIVEPDKGFDVSFVGTLAWEVLGSILLGLLLGFLVTMYLKKVGRELPLVILGTAFVSVAISSEIHLSGILACMVAGFYIENFSQKGDDLVHAIERHSLPVYVVFFTIAGAGLDLEALKTTWAIALTVAGARLLFTFLATWLGAKIAKDPKKTRNWAWSGFIGQAGVTLGFAMIIEARFPEIGGAVKNIIIAVIAINQIIGPVIFRLGLKFAGEIPEPEKAENKNDVPVPSSR